MEAHRGARLRHTDPYAGSDLLRCNLLTGSPTITSGYLTYFEREGLRHDPVAPILLLLDVPRGFAMHTLETLAEHPKRLVVITWDPSPEYWEDLWDLQPDVLLDNAYITHDLVSLLTDHSGERWRAPRETTTLTLTERQILRLLARGYSNRRIKTCRALEHQTVKNTVSSIYQKLHLPDCSAAVMYYWGIWAVGGGYEAEV